MNCVKSPGSSSNPNATSLATPEPHYIPGYLGYVPQEKFRPGNTYGMTSHRVLMDPCIHMSPRSVLNNIHPEHCTDEFGRPGLGTDPFLSSQMALVNSRVNSLGRQQYQPGMTPGYTGFVPRFQTILGHTYSPACNRALARFEQDQWRDRLFTKELEALDGWRLCYKSKPWESTEVNRPANTDLQEFARPRPKNAASGCGCACSGSNKGSRRGNAGPVAAVYMKGTQNDFGCGGSKQFGTLREGQAGAFNGISQFDNSEPILRGPILYPTSDALIPYYQGHVPGEQFRIGLTYGTSTYNAKRAIKPETHIPLCNFGR